MSSSTSATPTDHSTNTTTASNTNTTSTSKDTSHVNTTEASSSSSSPSSSSFMSSITNGIQTIRTSSSTVIAAAISNASPTHKKNGNNTATPHRIFIETQLLPIIYKLQKEVGWRKYKVRTLESERAKVGWGDDGSHCRRVLAIVVAVLSYLHLASALYLNIFSFHLLFLLRIAKHHYKKLY
jgi:hypothetical protein